MESSSIIAGIEGASYDHSIMTDNEEVVVCSLIPNCKLNTNKNIHIYISYR